MVFIKHSRDDLYAIKDLIAEGALPCLRIDAQTTH